MRLLLVEDDHPLARTMETMLREQHFTVDWVDDGHKALQAMASDRFDAMILDLSPAGHRWAGYSHPGTPARAPYANRRADCPGNPG